MNTFPLPAHAASDGTEAISARRRASARRFSPAGTVWCEGRAVFRSQLARDLGMLLDLDRAVSSWRCLSAAIEGHDGHGEILRHVPDFLVIDVDGSVALIDAGGPEGFRPLDGTVSYRNVDPAAIRREPALSNARDMMRYARRTVPLGDRIRLLAYLEEMSSVTLIEAASAMREAPEPVGAVMALALKRFVHVDWRDDIIGPDTAVRLRP